MASREFHEHQERMAERPQLDPSLALPQRRALLDEASAGVPLAPGVKETPTELGGVPAIELEREGTAGDPVLLYFHGGGYRIGSALGWRAYGSQLVVACRARVLLVDYRLAPENPYPAAVDDAVSAYAALLESGVDSARIVLGGDSAGGGLAAATLVAVRERGLALPAGAACLSPWADLTNRAESFRTRAQSDRLFSLAAAREAAGLYLGEHDPRDPLVSPVFADWTGLPALLIHAGDAEVLLDDAHALARRARDAGVEVQLSIYPEMPHVWHLAYPAFPEAVQAVREIAAFIDARTRAQHPTQGKETR